MSHYETLGVGKTASAEEIKKAYKKKVFDLHPDRNQADPNAEQKLKEVNEAYSVLSDAEKRFQYDNPQAGIPPFGPGGPGGPFETDLRDFFSQVFGQPRAEREVNGTVEQTLSELINGSERDMKVSYKKPCEVCVGQGIDSTKPGENCKECNGQGHKTVKNPFFQQTITCEKCRGRKVQYPSCGSCAGAGFHSEMIDLHVVVPRGVREGILKVGHDGLRRYFLVEVRTAIPADYTFEENGNVRTNLKIPYTKLCLGGKVQIKDLEGKILTVKIPGNTASGKVIRLAGKGIPHEPHGDHRGNLLLEIQAEVPKTLSQKQQDLLKELEKEGL